MNQPLSPSPSELDWVIYTGDGYKYLVGTDKSPLEAQIRRTGQLEAMELLASNGYFKAANFLHDHLNPAPKDAGLAGDCRLCGVEYARCDCGNQDHWGANQCLNEHCPCHNVQ
jgi:hypothetical protein